MTSGVAVSLLSYNQLLYLAATATCTATCTRADNTRLDLRLANT